VELLVGEVDDRRDERLCGEGEFLITADDGVHVSRRRRVRAPYSRVAE
jgi:hypothetical protein